MNFVTVLCIWITHSKFGNVLCNNVNIWKHIGYSCLFIDLTSVPSPFVSVTTFCSHCLLKKLSSPFIISCSMTPVFYIIWPLIIWLVSFTICFYIHSYMNNFKYQLYSKDCIQTNDPKVNKTWYKPTHKTFQCVEKHRY